MSAESSKVNDALLLLGVCAAVLIGGAALLGAAVRVFRCIAGL